MLYLHKLLPSVFLPIGITLVLVGAGLILRKRILCWTGIGILYLLSTGVVSGKIMGFIEGAGGRRMSLHVGQAQAIVILSGMLQERNDAPLGEWSDAVDRFEGGMELFQAGKAPVLIFTGGYVPWRPEDRPEGEILKERAIRLGVPREKIVVTTKVGNTEAEASAVKVLLKNLKLRDEQRQKGDYKLPFGTGQQLTQSEGERQMSNSQKPRIILVTSAFHMRRAKMLFERQGFEVETFPVDFQNSDRPTFNVLSFVPSAQALAKSETAMREGMGLLYYTLIKR